MLAVTAASIDRDDPLRGLVVGEHADATADPGWEVVELRAATLNHHDLWTLRGVGISAEQLPIVLGCDGAGVTADGREVIVHSVVGSPAAGAGDETLDPDATLLSERYDGTLAERVAVPSFNLVPKPPELSWAEAACLPTAWLTAYRMLFTRGRLQPGERVLVQGAGGGVATALIVLGKAAGLRVFVTSRNEERLAHARQLGADVAVPTGERLPERVHAVMETVGQATWAHSLRALEPGGRLVVSGATSGDMPPADLRRVFRRQLQILGSTMGSRAELERLVALLVATGVRPVIDSTWPLAAARDAFERLLAGDAFGKVVVTPE